MSAELPQTVDDRNTRETNIREAAEAALETGGGVRFENPSPTVPLVILRYFSPEANPDVPNIGAERQDSAKPTNKSRNFRQDLLILASMASITTSKAWMRAWRLQFPSTIVHGAWELCVRRNISSAASS